MEVGAAANGENSVGVASAARHKQGGDDGGGQDGGNIAFTRTQTGTGVNTSSLPTHDAVPLHHAPIQVAPTEGSPNLQVMPKYVAPTQAVPAQVVPLGRLALVDLAGSERNYETSRMRASQHKESGDINTSLMALKDCFRAHAANRAAAMAPVAAAGSRVANHIQSSKSGATSIVMPVTAGRGGCTAVTAAGDGAAGTAASSTSATHTTTVEPRRRTKAPPPPDVAQLRPARPVALAGGRMPFRAHRLTQVLKGCFTDPTHRTARTVRLSAHLT